MKNNIKRSIQMSFSIAMVVPLMGCLGGGLSSVNDILDDSNGVLEKLDNVDGTMGYAMDIEEKTFTAQQALSTKLSRGSGGSTLTVADGPSFSAKKNFMGGLDVEVDGKAMSLQTGDQVGDTAWYNSSGTNADRFSLSLWNAGKDAHNGLLGNAEGQNYHKIIGYDYTDDATSTQARGHVVYGETTSLSDVQALEKTAKYHGYFSAFITPQTMSGDHYDSNSAIMSGGVQFVADFDKNTISGQSTTITLREAGSTNFENQNFDVRFESAEIVSDGQGGAIYSGNMASDHSRMNGANYTGSFFGNDAAETAGVISGATTETSSGLPQVIDGFFSAAK